MPSLGSSNRFRLAFKAGSPAPYASSPSSSFIIPIKISEEEILYFRGLQGSDGSDMISLGPKKPERDGCTCFASISACVMPSAIRRTFSACSLIFVRRSDSFLARADGFSTWVAVSLRFPEVPRGEEHLTYCVFRLLAIGF